MSRAKFKKVERKLAELVGVQGEDSDLATLIERACAEIEILREFRERALRTESVDERRRMEEFHAALDRYCTECGTPAEKWHHAATCSQSGVRKR